MDHAHDVNCTKRQCPILALYRSATKISMCFGRNYRLSHSCRKESAPKFQEITRFCTLPCVGMIIIKIHNTTSTAAIDRTHQNWNSKKK